MHKYQREYKMAYDFNKVRNHFISRLKERYGIEINDDEYALLCLLKTGKGVMSKSRIKSVIKIKVSGQEVICMYNSAVKVLETALPKDALDDEDKLIRAVFAKKYQHEAKQKFELYRKEWDGNPPLASAKDAYLYFSTNSKFTPLHMRRFKEEGMPTIIEIAQRIKYIAKLERQNNLC